jgi:hypothetical protein
LSSSPRPLILRFPSIVLVHVIDVSEPRPDVRSIDRLRLRNTKAKGKPCRRKILSFCNSQPLTKKSYPQCSILCFNNLPVVMACRLPCHKGKWFIPLRIFSQAQAVPIFMHKLYTTGQHLSCCILHEGEFATGSDLFNAFSPAFMVREASSLCSPCYAKRPALLSENLSQTQKKQGGDAWPTLKKRPRFAFSRLVSARRIRQ